MRKLKDFRSRWMEVVPVTKLSLMTDGKFRIEINEELHKALSDEARLLGISLWDLINRKLCGDEI